jgi:steroid 5-alpha reductase family enzyme
VSARDPASEVILTSALPTVILNSPAVSDPIRGGVNPAFGTGRDIAGVILFVIGLFWEAVGDVQKVRICSAFGYTVRVKEKQGLGLITVHVQIFKATQGPILHQGTLEVLEVS